MTTSFLPRDLYVFYKLEAITAGAGRNRKSKSLINFFCLGGLVVKSSS